MKQETTTATHRKKFLLWGAAILSSFTVLKYFTGKKKNELPPADTVKMLTQDGRLVVIDKTLLASSNKKATKEELQHWVKK